MKIAYAFDPESHEFAGPVELDEGDISPLEPDQYLIPGNCLEAAPPVFDPAVFRCFARKGRWSIEPIPPEPPAPPGPTLEQRAAALLVEVDAHLNNAARAKGYDSIVTAALRAALPASPFHAEGVAFGNWMDAVYAKCYQVLALVKAGAMHEPDKQQLIAMLPPLHLPESKGA